MYYFIDDFQKSYPMGVIGFSEVTGLAIASIGTVPLYCEEKFSSCAVCCYNGIFSSDS
ncbi:MAG: hypothetical protein HDQ97_17750 [Lachnospiraceae bacterium]|nr:hypothetical protein [Lachnospiraceae bacterium]